MTDLDKLIEAVEAGGTIAWGLGGSPPRKTLPMHWHGAMNAYLGSLDAALRLHEALLPGWRVKQLHQFEAGHWLAGVYHPQDDDWPKWTPYPAHEATSSTPARAWLLAILRALKAQGAKE